MCFKYKSRHLIGQERVRNDITVQQSNGEKRKMMSDQACLHMICLWVHVRDVASEDSLVLRQLNSSERSPGLTRPTPISLFFGSCRPATESLPSNGLRVFSENIRIQDSDIVVLSALLFFSLNLQFYLQQKDTPTNR